MLDYDLKELNFNEETISEDLRYASAVYNVECCGLTWDDVKRIFPDSGALMEARYLAENGVNEYE